MAPGLVLSALLSLAAAQGQSTGVPAFQPRFHISFQPAVSQGQSARVPAVQPRIHIRFQPAVSHPVRPNSEREVICGMVVIHKTAADDPRILLPARETGAAVRRIQPQICGGP